MDNEVDIPHGPIQLGYTLGGFRPQVGLHRRGRAYYQQSSYWHLWLSGLFLVAAVVSASLPLWSYTKSVMLVFVLFTGACGAAPYFLRNRYRQTVIIDLERRTVCIKQEAGEKKSLGPTLQHCNYAVRRSQRSLTRSTWFGDAPWGF
jgi:hypothetical protein